MFAKVGVIVVFLGACACALLAMRQSRLQMASELAQAQLRIQSADERLLLRRAQIAERVTPQNVRKMAMKLGPMNPIVGIEPTPPEPTAPAPPKAVRKPLRVAERRRP